MNDIEKLTKKEIKAMVDEASAYLATKKGQDDLLATLAEADEISRKLDESRVVDWKMMMEPITI